MLHPLRMLAQLVSNQTTNHICEASLLQLVVPPAYVQSNVLLFSTILFIISPLLDVDLITGKRQITIGLLHKLASEHTAKVP